jgi:AraC family transcriptional activator of pobA
MYLEHTVPKTNGKIFFIHQEQSPDHRFKINTEKEQLLSIAVNTGPPQQITIDGISQTFPTWSLIPLVSNQSFSFENTGSLTIWQYNRDFYCLIDNNPDISCMGYLFFGFTGNLFIPLQEADRKKIENLQEMFIEEFESTDNIKTDMLQMLLKRLIIITTRLAKSEVMSIPNPGNDKFDLIRSFNVLVYRHYKTHHDVKFYADLLNKSPKTLANLFLQYRYKSPSLIIQERIISEAKRLFCYSDRSSKEIAFESGFEDAAHFSRFFKNHTNQTPSEFKNQNTVKPMVA